VAGLFTNQIEMKKEYVVRDLESNLFYGSITFGWVEDIKLSYRSNSIEDAERVISKQPKGYYVIDTVYVS
jgi:hypothetical protein